MAYGHTSDRPSLREIELDSGDRIFLAPIRAERLKTVRVTGVARWADGRPVADALVSSAGVGERASQAWRSAGKTNADGTFTLELLRGAGHTISVHVNSAERGEAQIVAGDEPLTIIVRRSPESDNRESSPLD